MLDFHNHLMPGVDDGAADIDEARAGLQALAADGVSEIITTPHLAASLAKRGELQRYLDIVDRGWEKLSSLAASEFPYLRVERGFEIMLDLPHPVLEDPVFHLAGTQFVLVEFPYMNIPPNSAFAVRELKQAGLTPIVAHPERYSNMSVDPSVIEQWRDAGAYMQVNAGSLVGAYGSRAKQIAWNMLGEGNADYLCSDYHSRGKCSVASAIQALHQRGFEQQVATLRQNGLKILKDELPEIVAPFEGRPRSSWKKVFPWA